MNGNDKELTDYILEQLDEKLGDLKTTVKGIDTKLNVVITDTAVNKSGIKWLRVITFGVVLMLLWEVLG